MQLPVWKTQFYSRYVGPLALTIFLPLFPRCSVSLNYRDCVVDISTWARHPMISYSLHFENDICFLKSEGFDEE